MKNPKWSTNEKMTNLIYLSRILIWLLNNGFWYPRQFCRSYYYYYLTGYPFYFTFIVHHEFRTTWQLVEANYTKINRFVWELHFYGLGIMILRWNRFKRQPKNTFYTRTKNRTYLCTFTLLDDAVVHVFSIK